MVADIVEPASGRTAPGLAQTGPQGRKGRGQAAVVQHSDMFANAVKPRVLAAHLRTLGFEVRHVESNSLGRSRSQGIRRWLPSLTSASVSLYTLDALQALARTLLRLWSSPVTRYFNGLSLVWDMRARGKFLALELRDSAPDVLICESALDQAVMLHRVATKQVLDLPSPFGDELLFAKKLSPLSHGYVRALEEQCLAAGDRVSFHWHTYEEYVRSAYRADARWLQCWYGVTQKTERAKFSARPRVVFLGSLLEAWVNLPLLERLSERLPGIDIWGGPRPQKSPAIRYLGYAPSLDILAGYTIGLVTISDDPLRRLSFSSKQLEYFSYGLPVLAPAWRADPLLAPATLPYTEENFLDQVTRLTERTIWEEMSAKALELASELSWESALAPLTEYLCS